ncbi:MAG TPA: hypothetical protein VH092_33190 [Urbifossiella sp.]|jgi:hypothetical protein|nr:hypothetical protein [Urbifossiella sp.]
MIGRWGGKGPEEMADNPQSLALSASSGTGSYRDQCCWGDEAAGRGWSSMIEANELE